MGKREGWEEPQMHLSSGPSLLPGTPILHRVCKQKPTERSRLGKGTLQALAFNSTSQGAPGHSGRLQCRKERGSLPALSDPATSWRETEFLSPPNSSERLAREPSGMRVCKAVIASIPVVPAASFIWSKTGSESHLLPFFPPTSGV